MQLIKSGFSSLILFFFLGMQLMLSQNLQIDNTQSNLTITGTSSLHNWTIDAKTLDGKAILITESDKFTIFKTLTFSVSIDGLKGKKSGMNKKIRSTLKIKENKTIDYQFQKLIKIEAINTHTYKVETVGLLTIAKKSKQISLLFTIEITKNKIRITGEKDLKMTDFNINPPKAFLGMLKVGDSVKIIFDVQYQ
ncbi:MAG: YceI family protein [Flavobacteriaceae bacterium]|nr:YceI family protein [Flavobacteriaceae bacterium]